MLGRAPVTLAALAACEPMGATIQFDAAPVAQMDRASAF